MFRFILHVYKYTVKKVDVKKICIAFIKKYNIFNEKYRLLLIFSFYFGTLYLEESVEE